MATLHQYIRLFVLDPFLHPKRETFTAVHLKFGKRSKSCCQVSKTGMGLLAVEHVLNTDLNNCVCKHVAQVTASFNCVSKPLATLSVWICFSLCTLALFPAFPPSSMQKRKGGGMVHFIMCCPTVQYVKMKGEGLIHLSCE